MSNVTLFGVAVVGLFLLVTGSYFKGKYDGKAEERGIAAIAAVAAQAKVDALEAAAVKISQEAASERDAKIRELEARVRVLSVVDDEPIRVCESPRGGPAASVPGITSEPQPVPVPGGSDMQAGEDIRQELLVYAADCERWRSQLVDVLDWQISQQNNQGR